MVTLAKKYKHQESEKKWQEFWRKNKIYKWDKDLSRQQTFVIDTPPPTVSGVLHMGHIFSYVQADFVARYQRMKGKTVFYPMGFDDNGLPTERLVEKVKKIRGVDMNRSQFIKECQSVVEEAEEQFEELFNSIALSVDWDEKYQTISPNCQKISQLSFIDLFQKGFVERKLEPVLWDIADRTALSQADLIDKEKPSSMNDIEFGIEGSAEKIIIATTRPELLSACVAVMVNPDDTRYQHLIGKTAITAIFGVKVKIIADDLVKMDKGTGAVMCCTFGDETDILWWRKHNLDLRIILDKSGRIIDNISWLNSKIYDNLVGLTHKEARKKILEIAQEQNILKKSEDITHTVKCAERSGMPIEILVMPQWFIKILDIKDKLKEKANECNWYPNFMKLRIEQWIEGVSWDWCISRQRFFGVAFPLWYVSEVTDKNNQKIIIADVNQLPCDPLKTLPNGFSLKEKLSEGQFIATKDGKEYHISGETDIMDTWATSSISPQLSSHAINEDLSLDGDIKRYQKLFPADLRPQAHEIIRTWAFYTIVKAYLHEEKIPWQNLMISGWCLASDKTKMSKSKGNVITPNALIQEKGSDIVRYWASTSNLGADTAYSEDVLKIGAKLLNKLYNAAKFVCGNFEYIQEKPTTIQEDIAKNIIFNKSDLWILSRLQQTIKKAEIEFDKFEYAKARTYIEDFFWNDFCDNYLEIVKVRAYGLKAQKYENIELSPEQKAQILSQQQSGIVTLYHILQNLLKVFAPFIPHICEELFQAIFNEDKKEISVNQRGSWPKLAGFYLDENLFAQGQVMLEVIAQIRKFKSDNNISLRTPLKSFTVKTNIDLSNFINDIKDVTNANEILIEEVDIDLIEVFDILLDNIS